MHSFIQRGQLFVVSAPSGAGKTTIISNVMPKWPAMHFSVSCTTRAPRAGEIPGKDYHFLSREDFLSGIETGRFLEWAEVHGQFYGTDGQIIESWLSEGKDVLLDIDVQGARQVRCTLPSAHTIFILPPSLEELEVRLKSRGTESAEQLSKRLTAAQREILYAPWYDYIVINDKLNEAMADFDAILRATHCHHTVQASRLKALFPIKL